MLKRLFFSASLAPILIFACTDSDGVTRTGQGDGGKSTEDANTTENDTGTSADTSTCTPSAAAVLDGGGPCGTLPFGKAAIDFVQTDASAGETYEGGVITPGIYDVVFAERGSTLKGSWRETIAVDGTGHFTRTRQIDQKGDGPGEVSYWSGTLSTSGDTVTFASSCSVVGDAGKDASNSSLPFDTKGGDCKGSSFRYGATGIRVTLEKR